MANFFKGLARANSKDLCGDLEGSITGIRGKINVSVEGGRVIAWVVGKPDIDLTKKAVVFEKITDKVIVRDFASRGGKPVLVNIYHIELSDGKQGVLRLMLANEYKVVTLIK